MKLGATTRFSQNEPLKFIPFAEQVGVELVRDGVNWNKIEPKAGKYVFDGDNIVYPDALADADVDLILLFGKPLAHVDGGNTPYSNAGRKAFAEFVSAVLDRFPNVQKIEIGNEFNGNNFVTGPVKSAGYDERADYYVKLLKAVDDKLEKTHPDVEIIGGATHSVPVGYLRDTFELGALQYSDGIAVHPYTSTPEHVGDHLALLKDAMGSNQQPIYVTEFSQAFSSNTDAANYLVKMSAALAAGGVEAATWFTLRENNYWPNRELIDKAGAPTPAGEAFSFMQDVLSRGSAKDITPEDGLARVVSFGSKAMVLWGEERDIQLQNGAKAYSARGELLKGTVSLDPDEPIVVLSNNAMKLGRDVKLGQTDLVGDVYMQFDVTNALDGSESFEGPWSWHYLRGTGQTGDFETLEGGHRKGTIWKPYLGNDALNPILATESTIRPIDFSDGKNSKARYDVVERFTADQSMTVSINGTWDVDASTTDGIDLTIFAGGDQIFKKIIKNAHTVNLSDVDLAKGETLDFVVGVNKSSKGDLTERSIQIFREGDGPSDDTPSDPPPPPPPSGTNAAPEVTEQFGRTLRLDEGDTKSVNLSKFITDADGDALSFKLQSGPNFASISGDRLVISPGGDDAGEAVFRVTGSDGVDTSAPLSIKVRVADTLLSDGDNNNDDTGGSGGTGGAPVIDGSPGRKIRLDEGSSKEINLAKMFSDPDGDELVFKLQGAPRFASIDGDQLVLAPGARDSGAGSLKVMASDGQDDSDALTINYVVRDTLSVNSDGFVFEL